MSSVKASRSTPFVTVSGEKNSGKTRLIELVVPRLVEAGLQFAFVKHDPHGHMDWDRRGKDTWRVHEAGVATVCIVGPQGLGLAVYGSGSSDHADAAEQLIGPKDLIIAEGFKDQPLARIALIGERGKPAHQVVMSATPVTHFQAVALSSGPLDEAAVLRFIAGLLDEEQRVAVERVVASMK